jgi:hypothetical protein
MSVVRAAYLSRMSERFSMQMFFPVEGDTAIVELLHDGDQWADLRLENLRVDAVGEDRLAAARIVLTICPREDGSPREFDLDAARAQLDEARDWLLENERGRQPFDDTGATAAARSAMKISRLDARWFPDEPG